MNEDNRDDTGGRGVYQVIRKWVPPVYWTPTVLFVVGVVSFAALIWANQIRETQHRDFDICDAIMDIRIAAGEGHLGMEEVIYEDTPVDLNEALGAIDLSITLAEAVLNGGKGERGQPLQPLKDSRLRARMEDLHASLTQFKAIALQRLNDPNLPRTSPELSERFHGLFKEIRAKADSLEDDLEGDLIRADVRAKRLFLSIVLAWAFVVVGATRGLWNREVRRRAAEKALEEANEELRSLTGELRKHEEHLTELVEERTTELSSANRDLELEILERKWAEKSRQASEDKCRILVDYLPQKIYLKNRHSVYLYCNDNFARDLDITVDQIEGRTDYDLFPREIAEKNRAEDEGIVHSGKPLDTEERHAKDGESVVIHKFMMPIRNELGGVDAILGILWDVTERVRLETIAEAVDATNNIGYVFANIRHEIGNPINSTKMTLSVLKKKIDTFSREKTEEYLDRAQEELSRVEYLLRTLKSFNMYETPELQNVEMQPFMDKFLSLLTTDSAEKGITVDTVFGADPVWACADPRALQQVMLNIVSNAFDAVSEQSDPKVVLDIAKVGGNTRIRVTDNGPGIPEEQQKRLFTPFFTTKSSGTGLGLVIVKRLLSRMKGTIEIRSGRGAGTTVDLLLPEGCDDL